MIALNKLMLGQRLLVAAAMVLCLAGVLTGVAIVQGRQQEQVADELSQHALPAVRLVHLAAQLVDEARGMEALHLLLRTEPERQAIEQQVAALRQRLDARLSSFQPAPDDATERLHLQAVRDAMARYWAAQDAVFAASHRAAASDATIAEGVRDPARVPAREQLAGASHQAWRALADQLQAWWTHAEQRAAQRSRQAQQSAARIVVLVLLAGAALTAGALSIAAVLLARRAGRAEPPAPPAPRPSGFGSALDEIAASLDALAPQASALAFGVAAAAGRDGAPSRELGLVAAELRNLALHADTTARALHEHRARLAAGTVEGAARAPARGTPTQV